MATGLFAHRGHNQGRSFAVYRAQQRKLDWPQSDIDRLCDIIADGGSFQDAADQLNKTKGAISSRWRRIVRAMGAQAR